MVSTKYLLILFVAFIANLLFAEYGYLQGYEINVYELGFSFVFGIAYVPLVVIKLPVFRSYYVKDNVFSINNKMHHNVANNRAAPVMVGLVTGISLAILLILFDSSNPILPSLCGAIAALISSFYYELQLENTFTMKIARIERAIVY